MGILFPVLFLAAASNWLTHLANVATYNVLNHHVQFFGLVVAPVMFSNSRGGVDMRDFPRLPAPPPVADTIWNVEEDNDATDSCEGSLSTCESFSKTPPTLGNGRRSALARRGGQTGFRIAQVLPPSAIGRDIPFSAQRPTRAASPFNTVAIGGGFDNGVVKVADARQGEASYFKIFAHTDDGEPVAGDDDLFFTELYKIDRKGTGQWESDGGLSTYRPLANIEAPPPPPPLPSEFLSGKRVMNATALYEEEAFPIAAGSTRVCFTVNTSRHAGYYSGTYAPASTGSYQASVIQLLPGGIEANFWDNEGLLGAPVVRRVDPEVSFNWEPGEVTPCGQGPGSARWHGKLLAPSSETFTLFVRAQGGVRLFVDHRIVLNAWQGNLRAGKERLLPVDLVAGRFHDVRLEYRRQEGSASIQMLWASRSVPPSVIPSDAWHYSTPIAGSPFAVNVLPRERDVRDASMYYLDGISSVIAKVKEWLPPTNATRAKDPRYHTSLSLATTVDDPPAMVPSSMAPTAIADLSRQPWPDPALLEESLSREDVLVATAHSAASFIRLNVPAFLATGVSDGTIIGSAPWAIHTDMKKILPDAEPGALLPWVSPSTGYSQSQALPEAEPAAMVPWVAPDKEFPLPTYTLSCAEPGGALVPWAPPEVLTVYMYGRCYRIPYGVPIIAHWGKMHGFDAILAARYARRTASLLDHVPSTAEASGVSTDTAREGEPTPRIADTSQEPSPHDVVLVVETGGETAGLAYPADAEDPPAADRGTASSGEGVPAAASPQDAPVGEHTKPESSISRDEAVECLVYTASRALFLYAWVKRYHPSGMGYLTNWWVLCCLLLTSSQFLDGLLEPYAWPVVRFVVELTGSVGQVSMEYVLTVATLVVCMLVALLCFLGKLVWVVGLASYEYLTVLTIGVGTMGLYIAFKVLEAETGPESEHDTNPWAMSRPEPTPELPEASSQATPTEASALPLESGVATEAGEACGGRAGCGQHPDDDDDEAEQSPEEPTPELPEASSQATPTEESSLPLESEVATETGEACGGRAAHGPHPDDNDDEPDDEPEQSPEESPPEVRGALPQASPTAASSLPLESEEETGQEKLAADARDETTTLATMTTNPSSGQEQEREPEPIFEVVGANGKKARRKARRVRRQSHA